MKANNYSDWPRHSLEPSRAHGNHHSPLPCPLQGCRVPALETVLLRSESDWESVMTMNEYNDEDFYGGGNTQMTHETLLQLQLTAQKSGFGKDGNNNDRWLFQLTCQPSSSLQLTAQKVVWAKMATTMMIVVKMTTDLPNSLLKDVDTVPGQRLRGRSLLRPAASRRNPLPWCGSGVI